MQFWHYGATAPPVGPGGETLRQRDVGLGQANREQTREHAMQGVFRMLVHPHPAGPISNFGNVARIGTGRFADANRTNKANFA